MLVPGAWVTGAFGWVALGIGQPVRGGPRVSASVMIVLIGLFVGIRDLAARIGRWRDYVHGEVVYIVLSLTAKSLLAWLIFANVLRT